jgi:hypothetical protein
MSKGRIPNPLAGFQIYGLSGLDREAKDRLRADRSGVAIGAVPVSFRAIDGLAGEKSKVVQKHNVNSVVDVSNSRPIFQVSMSNRPTAADTASYTGRLPWMSERERCSTAEANGRTQRLLNLGGDMAKAEQNAVANHRSAPRGALCSFNVVGSSHYVMMNPRVMLIRHFILAKRPFPARLAHRHPVKKSIAGIMAFTHDTIASRAIINVWHRPQRLIGWKSIQDVSNFRQCEPAPIAGCLEQKAPRQISSIEQRKCNNCAWSDPSPGRLNR